MEATNYYRWMWWTTKNSYIGAILEYSGSSYCYLLLVNHKLLVKSLISDLIGEEKAHAAENQTRQRAVRRESYWT